MIYNKGDVVNINMEGFMGIEFPTVATVKEVCYKVSADTGNGCYTEMILNEDELLNRLIQTK